MELEGVSDGDIDMDVFNFEEYLCLADQLLEYTRENLSSDAMAKYLLKTTQHEDAKNILFLSGSEISDYVRDTLLMGLKSLMRDVAGGKVVDFVKHNFLYNIPVDTKPHDWSNEGFYGNGFTYAHWLDGRDEEDRSRLVERIKEKEFDLIIFGSIHRGMPFLDLVFENYGKDDIVFVDGEDIHGWCKWSTRLVGKGWFFMREIPVDSCP